MARGKQELTVSVKVDGVGLKSSSSSSSSLRLPQAGTCRSASNKSEVLGNHRSTSHLRMSQLPVYHWVTVHKAATVYTWIQTNTHSLLRELSGPRPFRQVVDIVSKPRIWSRDAKAILLENGPTLQVTGSGRTATTSASTVPYAGTNLNT